MTLKMSHELQRAVAESGREPLQLLDPQTNSSYIVVPAEQYKQMLRTAEIAALQGAYPAQEKLAAREGWDARAMDDYNDYDANHRETA